MKILILVLFISCSCYAETRYYIAPIVDMARGQGVVKASKVLEHSSYFDDTTFVSCVMPNPIRNWCWTKVTAKKQVFDALEADGKITLLPFIDSGGNYLPGKSNVESIAPDNKTKSFSILESSGIPTNRFYNATTIDEMVSMIEKSMLVVQLFGQAYPKKGLDETLTVSERSALVFASGEKGIVISLSSGATVKTFIWKVIDGVNWKGISQ